METKVENRTALISREDSRREASELAPRIQIKKLTLMLTETCNLDCWMCDFAKSKKLTKVLSASPAELTHLLMHPVFAHLKVVTLTGGEPFAHPQVRDYYLSLRRAFDHLHIYFSSNGTLLPKMVSVFDTVENWNSIGLFVSIDGVAKHDVQRRTEGAFVKTAKNLEMLRSRFPKLDITLKFTITPMNYDDVWATYRWACDERYSLTIKMLEFNEFYTNKLRIESDREKFNFTPDERKSISAQLGSVLADVPPGSNPRRVAEIRELLDSLSPEWRRPGKCLTPTKGAFLDCDLNLFTCKEYPPIINLGTAGLDDVAAAPGFHEICRHERQNTGHCTRCTSQMKMQAGARNWRAYFKSLIG